MLSGEKEEFKKIAIIFISNLCWPSAEHHDVAKDKLNGLLIDIFRTNLGL